MNSITCQLVSEETGKAFRCRIKRRDESHYDISYEPTIKGRHQLQIQIKGHHIKGSPFSIFVEPSLMNIPIRIIDNLKGLGGIAVTHEKEVVVAEKFGQQMTVFSPSDEKLRSFPMLSSSNNCVANQVAVDSEGNIFVTDCEDHCIRKFTAQGEPLIEMHFDIAIDKLSIPSGIAIYSDRIYVVCGEIVQILNSDLSLYSTFGAFGIDEGYFRSPQNISCDYAGNVYVADMGNSCIQVFTTKGKFIRMFGNEKQGNGKGKLILPHGIAVAGDRVYVSDWGNHCVSVFILNGEFVTSFGGKGNKPGQFQYPDGLAVDSEKGMLYVSDTGNDRIQIFEVAQ